jgi:twitching motility protein PilT
MSETLAVELEKLLAAAQPRRPSDMHLIPGEPPTLRIDGILESQSGDPLTSEEVMRLAATMIPQKDLERIGSEVAEFHRAIAVGALVARVTIARAYGGITIAARLLQTTPPGVEVVYMPPGLLTAAGMPSGLIIITGRIGSGKSTTAYSLLDYINANRRTNIHTVETWMAYRLSPKKSLIQQREVGIDVPDLLSGIKVPLSMDLDVLFVSEVPNLEALQACLTAAETGHLVIMVMHAESPEGAIRRFIEVFPEHTQPFYRRALAGVLKCVSNQRLIPRADGSGRTAAYGVLLPDEEMKKTIEEGGDVLKRLNPMPDGCQTMKSEIERLAKEGVISEEKGKTYLADI